MQRELGQGLEFTAPSIEHYLSSQFGEVCYHQTGFRNDVVVVTFSEKPCLFPIWETARHDATYSL